PWMSKPFTSRSVSQSISIETKNHAIPSVTTAIGSVSRRRIGFTIVFRIPKTAAAVSSCPIEPRSMSLKTAATMPSGTAFAGHETRGCLRKPGTRIVLRDRVARGAEREGEEDLRDPARQGRQADPDDEQDLAVPEVAGSPEADDDLRDAEQQVEPRMGHAPGGE